MDITATNYQPLASADDGNCTYACNVNLESIVSLNSATTTDASSIYSTQQGFNDGMVDIAFTIPANPAWDYEMRMINTNTNVLYPINPSIDFGLGIGNTYGYSDSNITLSCARNINSCWECNLIALNLSAAEYSFFLDAEANNQSVCKINSNFVISAPPPCELIDNCRPCQFTIAKDRPGYLNIVNQHIINASVGGPQCSNNYLNGVGLCAGTMIRVSWKWNASSGFPTPNWQHYAHTYIYPKDNNNSTVLGGEHGVLNKGESINIISPYNTPGTEFKAVIRVYAPSGMDSPCENPNYWTVGPVPGSGFGPNTTTYYQMHTQPITW